MPILTTSALPMLPVYMLAAVLPAVFLLYYIYRHDTVEKEPVGLLLTLLLCGVLSALCASLLEGIGRRLLNAVAVPGSLGYTVLLAFVVIALSEEGMKLFFLKRRTWNDPNFNYRFDGIVYAVFVSLGFAIYENILYVFRSDLSAALLRADSAVPAHMSFAVVMGVLYGRARLMENRGEYTAARLGRGLALVCAVLLHGFYDACAMVGTGVSVMVFIVFVITMFVGVYGLIKIESSTDSPV